jgi:hypothetical protein
LADPPDLHTAVDHKASAAGALSLLGRAIDLFLNITRPIEDRGYNLDCPIDGLRRN